MKASTAIPLTIAGAIWALTTSYIAFIVYRIIKLPFDDEPALIKPVTTHIRTRARSCSPFPHYHNRLAHWRRNRRRACSPDIELQPLPRLKPKRHDRSSADADADADAMTCWPSYSGGPASPANGRSSSPSSSSSSPSRPAAAPSSSTTIFPSSAGAFANAPLAPHPRVPQHPHTVVPHRRAASRAGDATAPRRFLASPTAPAAEFKAYRAARSAILDARRARVLLVAPTAAADAACAELREAVVGTLCVAWPGRYEVSGRREGRGTEEERGAFGEKAGACFGEWRGGRDWGKEAAAVAVGRKVCDGVAGVEVVLDGEGAVHPLEAVARLVLEDFGVFVRGRGDRAWTLVAGVALCPSGWRLAAAMNKPPVDASGFCLPVNIDNGEGEGVPVVRHFIQFSQRPHTVDLADMLFVEERKDLFPGRRLRLEHMMLRKEVHTCRRLPRSDAAVVAVRTTIKPLVDLESEEMEELVRDVESWPSYVAISRGKFLWEGLVMEFCGNRLSGIT